MNPKTPARVIPQADPKANYLAHKAEIDAAIHRVLESGSYILGPEVEAFEQEFASYVGVPHAVGVGNGTDALELALRAIGVGPGDLVFTVSHTAVATVAAIELTGAAPVLVDIDPVTYTMDPGNLATVLAHAPKGRPKAVIPVHLYGQPADMPAILEIARQYGLMVIEDCAQSLGAMLGGRRTGSWGDMAAFSFYPTKNLGALGDGGMVTTHDPALSEEVRSLRQYGWQQQRISHIPGGNSRLDELQAAILRVKLRYLDEENDKRRKIAAEYSKQLAVSSVRLPVEVSGSIPVYHQYVVRSEKRDLLRAHLKTLGVDTAVHYPVPVHQQPAYEGNPNIAPGGLTATERSCMEILSLPMFPELPESAIQTVCEAVRSFKET
ncbi:MAG: DegT/DnrJ/EryC1/StrS family aminotransferase [Candidatus Omnitrophota bacterium]